MPSHFDMLTRGILEQFLADKPMAPRRLTANIITVIQVHDSRCYALPHACKCWDRDTTSDSSADGGNNQNGRGSYLTATLHGGVCTAG